MHISSTQVNRVLELHLHRVHSLQGASTDSIGHADELTLSNRVNEIQTIRGILSAMPDVRQSRVRDMQSMLSSGTYQPSDTDIASAMFNTAAQYASRN